MNILTCIYSSHEDKQLASMLQSYINRQINTQCIIVLADENLTKPYKQEQDILYLKVKECYTCLSLKTLKMLTTCHELYEFDVLVKIDAGVMNSARHYRDGESHETLITKLKQYINDDRVVDYWSPLGGGITPSGNRAWMTKNKQFIIDILKSTGRDLETERVFTSQCNYKRGKFYTTSRKFVKYIYNNEETQNIFHQMYLHGGGSEDVSVGLAFEKFKNDR